MVIAEPLILYSREDCHLCDQVARMLEGTGLPWRAVDIGQDEDLDRIYGLRIPVVKDPDTGRELCYPFSEQELRVFGAQ